MVLSLLNRWLLRIPMAIFLSWTLGWGAVGIWWSFLFADVTGFAIGAAWLKWGHWQQSLVGQGAAEHFPPQTEGKTSPPAVQPR
jgi:Na+-driven multidrug efflux pump